MQYNGWKQGASLAVAALLAACGATAPSGLERGGGHGGESCIVGDDDHDDHHKGHAHVDAHCPQADRYTVGGTVSGTTGTLVLDNLGIDTLPVTHDGPFTFTVKLADGAPYEVTITNQPSHHARICTVEHGAGVIDHTDVTDVAVTCVEAPPDEADDPGDEVEDPGDDPPADEEVETPDDPGDEEVDTPDDPDDEEVDTPDDPDDEVVETPDDPDDEVAETPDDPDDEVADTPDDPGDEVVEEEEPAAEDDPEEVEVPVEVAPTPDGADWNDYVLAGSGAPCDGTEAGPWGTCRHAGEMRDFPVAGRTDCDGLSALDDLEAFDWACRVLDGEAHMVTYALKPGVHLSDLLDFAATAWRDDALHVWDGDVEILATEAAPWWGNPVAAAAGDLDVPGGVYLVAEDTTARLDVVADRVALVVAPGAVLRGPGGEGAVVAARDRAFLWLEGRVDGAGHADAVLGEGLRFCVLDGVRVQGADHAGIHLGGARACRVKDVTAVQNGTYGLRLDSSEGTLVQDLVAAGNALSGLHLVAGEDNRIAGVTATGNGNWGVALRATSGNVLMDVTAANQVAYGVWLDEAPGNTLMNVAAVNNGTAGIYLFASDGTVLSDLALTDNRYAGLAMNDSSFGHVTGRFLMGGNLWDCAELGGTAPGVETVTCEGTDGSDPVVTGGVSLAASFMGPLTEDDAANPDDGDGLASNDTISDWTTFAHRYRHWAREAAFPTVAAWGRCAEGTCRIWDWGLAPADTLARGALAPPDGTRALAHGWSAGGVSVFVPGAMEVAGDGAGNEDLLCEAGETCVFTPNVASDQGDGAMVPLGVLGAGGAVADVTLLAHEVPAP